MKIRRFLFVAVLAISCVGCQSVLVRRPIGTPVNEDLSKQFDGVWQSEDGKYIFYVKAGQNGVLDVAGIEWLDGKFAIRDTSCIVTKVGDWEYLNVPLPPDSLGRRYFLFAPFFEDGKGNAITAFLPSSEFFENAIKKNELIGDSVVQSSGPLHVDDQMQNFFKARTGEIIRSSEAYILRRTREGKIDAAWPPNQ